MRILGIFLSFFGGMMWGAFGGWLLPEQAETVLLWCLLLWAGATAGCTKATSRRSLINGIIISVLGTVGSLAGALICGMVLGVSPSLSFAAGGSMGWYTLGGAVIHEALGPAAGTVVFCAALCRELSGFICIPLLLRRGWEGAAVAWAGATAEDTSLTLYVPAGGEVVSAAVISGSLCSLLVPILLQGAVL